MPALELTQVAEAFDALGAFLAEGQAHLDGDGVAKLTEAIATAQKFLADFKRCLDGVQCPATVHLREFPSGLMQDRDTPGPMFVEFATERQGP